MIAVRSSNLRAVGYDPITATLVIEFRGGRLYRYARVSDSVYQGLMRAGSHGAYFHARIRNRYPCRRIR
jgi:hypothetical protein